MDIINNSARSKSHATDPRIDCSSIRVGVRVMIRVRGRGRIRIRVTVTVTAPG